MDLTEFIYESNKCSSADELTNKFLRFLHQFGFDRFVMSEMSHDSRTDKESNHGILVNYPQEWMEHYVANHYIDHDPVYQRALTARRPFTWKEVTEDKKTPLFSKKVMEEAREFNLHDGVALTIYQPLGEMIGMGFSGSETGVRTDVDALSIINAASHQFFIAYSDFIQKKSNLQSEVVSLTPREVDVLFWMARGKTRGEIADILVISESAVKRYLEACFRKLSVNNGALAVAKALRMGIIKPY